MNSELIDIKLTVAPFLQISQIHNALNSIRVYQFIINKNLEEYYRNIELNYVDMGTQLQMDNIIGIMECLNLYQRDSYKATQRNLEILNIQKSSLKYFRNKEMFVKETMKVKMCLRDYHRKTYYSDQSAPSIKTLRNRCEKGKVTNAIKEGGRWYIEVEVTREIKDKN